MVEGEKIKQGGVFLSWRFTGEDAPEGLRLLVAISKQFDKEPRMVTDNQLEGHTATLLFSDNTERGYGPSLYYRFNIVVDN